MLLATKVISGDQVSFSNINELANQAFRTSERTFCGDLMIEFICDGDDYSKFINFNEEQELVTISPEAEDQAGFYDQAYIRYYFSDYPDRQMSVQIISTVEECFFEEAEFIKPLLSMTYNLGNESPTIDLPDVTASPDCGIDPVIKNTAIFDVSLPDGFTQQ